MSQLLCAWLLRDLGQNAEILKRMQDITTRSHTNLEPEIASSIQEIIAVSRQTEKPQDSPIGGKELHKFWNDAIDRAQTNQKRWYRHEMFKAAVRDGYWDLAQQVCHKIISLSFPVSSKKIVLDNMLRKQLVVYKFYMYGVIHADSLGFRLASERTSLCIPLPFHLDCPITDSSRKMRSR